MANALGKPILRAVRLGAAVLLATTIAQGASTLGLTVGSPAVPLPNGLVACSDPGGGWVLEAGGSRVRPPSNPARIGTSAVINVGKSATECQKAPEPLNLVVIGRIPQVDRKTFELDIDQGRAEVTGTGLEGVVLWWRSATETGHDVCVVPTAAANQQHCSFATSRTLPADPARLTLYLLPAGAPGANALYDAGGQAIAAESLIVLPSKIVIDRVWPTGEVADLSSGEAMIPLSHADAVASVDCDRGQCRLEADMVSVRASNASTQGTNVRLQMRPRVFVRSGNTLLDRVVVPLDFAYCPLSPVSVGPFRDVDAGHVVVRLDERCLAIADSLTWSVNGNPVVASATYPEGNSLLVALGFGHISSNRLSIVGSRDKNGNDVVAVASIPTLAAPRIRTKILLEGFGELGFLPTNRPARLSATAPKMRGQLVPQPIEGVYAVTRDRDGYWVKGARDADGFVALRFSVRDPSLPGDLANLELASIDAPEQRELREVNVAAPVAVPIGQRPPFVELLCNDPDGRRRPVLPGTTPHLHFSSRDSCHLLVHRERILPEDGEQRLDIRVEVRSASGASRSGGDLHQRLVLRHGREPLVLWLGGVEAQFDKLIVHISHAVDETQYLRDNGEKLEVPAATYSVVFENTNMRFYATVAMPTSLFRFSNEANGAGNGALTLNIGVLSRLTWVTREGNDGLFGLEAGVMGMGLSSQNTRQLNLVAGVGMAVPLGNPRQLSQAAINLHAWVAYRPGRDTALTYDALGNAAGAIELSNWSFVFGPSVTFGSVGLDL